MTLLQAIQSANTATGYDSDQLRFVATEQEFNSYIDGIGYSSMPYNVVLAPTFSGARTSSRNVATVNITGFFFRRIAEDTNDFRSIEIEDTIMQPIRAAALKFINALLDTDIIDPEVDRVAWRLEPRYQSLATHYFGYYYTVTLPVTETVCKT